MLVAAAMSNLITEAGEGVLVLLEYVDEHEFARSRLTRQEVQRQLQAMAGALEGMPPAARGAMPEIDWEGWRALARSLGEGGADATAAAWFAARSLVPATLMWLRVYRQSAPALFEFRPG